MAFWARVLGLSMGVILLTGAEALEVIPSAQWRQAKNVTEFQPFIEFNGPVTLGQGKAKVSLTNLNRYVNMWYLVDVFPNPNNHEMIGFHIENPRPETQRVHLTTKGEIAVHTADGQQILCGLINEDGRSGALFAALKQDPYTPVCQGRLYLRNPGDGRKDAISWVTTGLREVFGEAGDDAVNMVKETIYDGKFFESGKESQDRDGQIIDEGGPLPAEVRSHVQISDHGLGFELIDDVRSGLKIGQWYKAKNFDGVYLSVMKAKYVTDSILRSYTDRVAPLDNYAGGESDALVNSLAIDLDVYRFAWANGTEHPGVGWSPRAQSQNGRGPDGFDTLRPLVIPGVVSPAEASQTVGILTGGFQRLHSAFKWGPLAGANQGHHYGFMEKGVMMSTLVPNLASWIVYLDGTMELKTWTQADNHRLSQMRDVRQNGVPLIETDPTTGKGIPGAFVNQWGAGNWSGSANKELKTPRTSACLVERDQKRYLVISYFSTHTPSGMARVLQSYQCRYAIHLDMNHPRFAYTAFFRPSPKGDFKIEHLSKSMADDVKVNGKIAPRSLLTPTYKDFFYVMKKSQNE